MKDGSGCGLELRIQSESDLAATSKAPSWHRVNAMSVAMVVGRTSRGVRRKALLATVDKAAG